MNENIKIKIEPGLLQAMFRALDEFVLNEEVEIEVSDEAIVFLRGLLEKHPDPQVVKFFVGEIDGLREEASRTDAANSSRANVTGEEASHADT